jgi:hypothetical protein
MESLVARQYAKDARSGGDDPLLLSMWIDPDHTETIEVPGPAERFA